MRAGEEGLDPLGFSVCVCVCCFSWAALVSSLTFTKIAAGRLLHFKCVFCCGPNRDNAKSRWRETETEKGKTLPSSVDLSGRKNGAERRDRKWLD